MKEKVLVSIVMPVYNCERYISDTLKSVISQDYENLEIICISDGCTDKTLDMIKCLAETDHRIRIIDNYDNVGAATRRNQGLKIANGEWITFWDSDDLYEKNYVSDMIEYADEETQLLICNYDTIGTEIKANSYEFRDDQFDFRNVISCAPCNKMVRKSYLIENNIEFQNIPNCNDLYYSTVCLLKANHVKYLDRVLWHYRFEQNNNISKKRQKKCYIVSALNALYDEVKKQNNSFLEDAFASFARQHILGYRKYSSYWEIKREYETVYKYAWNIKLNLDGEFYIDDIEIFRDKRIVIVCAGGVGTDYYSQLISEGVTVVACLDNYNRSNSGLPVEISPVENIIDLEFDVAIIAVQNEVIAKQVETQLLKIGVNIKKIWWREPQKYEYE